MSGSKATIRAEAVTHRGPTLGYRITDGDTTLCYIPDHEPALGTPLDLWPNEFLSEDGRLIVCATHGALFEPSTGACIAGPCAGDALTRLAVRLEGGDVVVACPGS